MRRVRNIRARNRTLAGLVVFAVLLLGCPTNAQAQTSTQQVSPSFHGPAAGTWITNHYDRRYQFTCRTTQSTDRTWALWTWDDVGAGESSIAVYIPPHEATAAVTYVLTVPDTDRSSDQRIRIDVNQSEHRDRWVTLHRLRHGAGRIQLRLGDANTSAGGPLDWCWWGGHHSIGAADARLASAAREIVWVSSGDSYSSGTEGEGDCRRTDTSYGPTARGILQDRGWHIPWHRFEACSGAVAGAYGEDEGYWDSEDRTEYSEIDDDRPGSVYHDDVDVLTMSFGGNDIGFSHIVSRCAFWRSCIGLEQELETRIEELGEAMTDFYVSAIRDRLSSRGRLYLIGYPSLFASSSEWRSWLCETIDKKEGDMLVRAAAKLNEALKAAVDRANNQVAGTRAHYLDLLTLYRTGRLDGSDYDGAADGRHELCATPSDDKEIRRTQRWMNGAVWSRRAPMSFHPNAYGHAATAEALADLIANTFSAD